VEWSEAERREQTQPIVLIEGEARRRGGGTIYAANVPPLDYAYRDGKKRPWVGLVGGIPPGATRSRGRGAMLTR
jgi:hypothetical protein